MLHQHLLYRPGDGGRLWNQQPARERAAGAGDAQAAFAGLRQPIQAPDLSPAQRDGFRVRRCYGFHAVGIEGEWAAIKANRGSGRKVAGERIVAMRLRQTLIQINAAGGERAQNAGIFTG